MKKGISLIALTATIAIMLILVTTVTISGIEVYNNSQRIAFATEISSIQESVQSYIIKNGTNPGEENNVVVDTSKLSSQGLAQFSGENIVNNKLTLNKINYGLLGISSLKYGTNKAGSEDFYAMSLTTGKVYYVKGFDIGSKKYFTLTEDLKKIIGYETPISEGVNSDGITFVVSKKEWTNLPVTTTINVPKVYSNINVSANEVTFNLKSSNTNYNIYEVTGISTNYNIKITYTNSEGQTKTVSKAIDNVDTVIPILSLNSEQKGVFIDEQTSKKYAYIVVDEMKDEQSGIKTLKYESEKIEAADIGTYFKTNGKTVNIKKSEPDFIMIEPNTLTITVYLEDNAGNWTSKWVQVDPSIYTKLQ